LELTGDWQGEEYFSKRKEGGVGFCPAPWPATKKGGKRGKKKRKVILREEERNLHVKKGKRRFPRP